MIRPSQQNIIDQLKPLNSKEKIDTLIDQLNIDTNNVSSLLVLSISLEIRSHKMQSYFKEKSEKWICYESTHKKISTEENPSLLQKKASKKQKGKQKKGKRKSIPVKNSTNSKNKQKARTLVYDATFHKKVIDSIASVDEKRKLVKGSFKDTPEIDGDILHTK